MATLSNHFVIPVYMLIFEKDPPGMSQEEMEALIDIVDCYASTGGTFIKLFGREKPLHVLPRFSTDNLMM